MRTTMRWATAAALVLAVFTFPSARAGQPLYGPHQKLTASDGIITDQFGISVSLSGDIALVGANGDDDAGIASGSAYIYERNHGGTNSWGRTVKLNRLSSDGESGEEFGRAVSVDGDVALVGAYADDDRGNKSGSAYIFHRNEGDTNAWGQVRKLLASDAAAEDRFGYAVAVAGDVAVVGAYYDDNAQIDTGSAYVFERHAGGTNAWGQVAKLEASDPETGKYLGFSVAVDGDVAVAGAWGDDHAGGNAGSAYVFERNAGGTNAWGQVAKLTASDAAGGQSFGISVAVAGDVIAVGAYQTDGQAGAVYVFERNAGGINAWSQTARLSASDAAAQDYFGFAVASDGDTVLAGARFEDDLGMNAGAAYVFRRTEGGTNAWGQVRKITAPDGAAGNEFGYALDIDSDVALIGAYGFDTKRGAAYLLPASARVRAYEETKPLLAPAQEAWEQFGAAVAADGDIVLIGTPGDQGNRGTAYVHERNAGGTNAWDLVKAPGASDTGAGYFFGIAVAVDGDVALVGAIGAESSAGAAYIYERNADGTNAWGEVTKLVASDGLSGDAFGVAVAVGGDVAVVGAFEVSGGGAAYVFERNAGGTNAWGEVARLVASDRQNYDSFGFAVDIDGDVILVGAYGEDEAGPGAGAAYIFERDAGGINAWGEVRKVTAADAVNGAEYGFCVSVADDVAVVGAHYDTQRGGSSGSAYVYERHLGGTNHWGQIAKLTAADGAAGDQFAYAVATDGDVVLAGAAYDDDLGHFAGTAFLFERHAGGTNAWGQIGKLTASNGVTDDNFGLSVALAEDVALVGAPSKDVSGSYAGSAYLFQRITPPLYCAFSEVKIEAGSVILTWPSEVPVDYTLQMRDSLDEGHSWSNLTGAVDVPGVDGDLSATNAAPAVQQYYRLKAMGSPTR